jgi:hypothetical protein
MIQKNDEKLLNRKRLRESNYLEVLGIQDESDWIYLSSIVQMNDTTMKKYNLKESDYIILKHKDRKIIAMVLEDYTEIKNDSIRINTIMRRNLKVEIGYKVKMKRCSDIKDLEYIEIELLKETSEDKIKDYFRHIKKGVCLGNVFYIKDNKDKYALKVVGIKDGEYGYISHLTKINIIKKVNTEVSNIQVKDEYNLSDETKGTILLISIQILIMLLIYYKR